jgi:hypothetical protein
MAELAEPDDWLCGPVGGSILVGAGPVEVSRFTLKGQVWSELARLDASLPPTALPEPPVEQRNAFLAISRRLPVGLPALRRTRSAPTIDMYDSAMPTDSADRRNDDSDLSYDSDYESSSENSPPPSGYADRGETLEETKDTETPAVMVIAEDVKL